jgi:hypothetical protein
MDLLAASLKEKLWHKLRHDLQSYIPQIQHNNLLMCCTCGRFLPYDEFSLEHIIPQQALADDPPEIKANPETTANTRSGNILLCSKRLLIKDGKPYNNGCNSWKGRFYDGRIRELMNWSVFNNKYKKVTNEHIIAALCTAYLAMVLEFGYQITLTPSGVLMRHQFFSPSKFHPEMPDRSQIILSAPPLPYSENHITIWSHPFSFTVDIERNACFAAFRTISLAVPISRDPRLPIVQSLAFVPSKYKLRPDFGTVFN